VFSVRAVSPRTALLRDVSATEVSVVEVSRLEPERPRASSSTNPSELGMICHGGRIKPPAAAPLRGASGRDSSIVSACHSTKAAMSGLNSLRGTASGTVRSGSVVETSLRKISLEEASAVVIGEANPTPKRRMTRRIFDISRVVLWQSED